MPHISSNSLQPNAPIEGTAPDATLVVDNDAAHPLKVGTYTFQLQVVDDSGNKSSPTTVKLTVIDNQAPTAVISAPATVPFGTAFTLSGARSVDIGGGTIAKYIWTLIP